jgi:hypothetical protein
MLSPQRIDTPDVHLERSAFNAAFYELGLRWHWDENTYDALCAEPCERHRVRRYVEAEHPHLLRAYDADFLAQAVIEAKERTLRALARSPQAARPRHGWADVRWEETGI